MKEIITILCVSLLAAWAAWLNPDQAKDFIIPAVTGLVGYLARDMQS